MWYLYGVRLGTWNCQSGLDAHWDAIRALDAEVLTVQECGSHTEDQARDEGWACEWQAGGWHKGLAVLVKPPFRIEKREESEPYWISTVVDGPRRFRFVGFWAMTPSHTGFDYPQQAKRLIEALPRDDLPTVVAGDFNASRSRRHLANVKRLNDRGLFSAYHVARGVQHTMEADPTSYFRWQESRPYHMDFVFVPEQWAIEKVDVGTFADYSAPGGMSDHVPVIVSVAP